MVAITSNQLENHDENEDTKYIHDLQYDLEMKLECHGTNHPQVAVAYTLIAQEQIRRHEFMEALDSYQSALFIFKTNNQSNSNVNGDSRLGLGFVENIRSASICKNIGILYKKNGQFYKALSSFNDALTLYRSCYHQHLLINATNNQRKSNDAHSIDKNGEKNESSLLLSSLGNINLELNIATTLRSIAKLHMRQTRNIEFAIQAYEDIVEFLVQAEKNAKYPTHSTTFDSPTSNSKHHHVKSNSNILTKEQSPSTVMSYPDHTQMHPLRSSGSTQQDLHSIISNCVHPLSEHERIRIIVSALNSLASIQFELETQSYSHQQEQEQQERQHEDAIDYYQESLSFLSSLPEPIAYVFKTTTHNIQKTLRNHSVDFLDDDISSYNNNTPLKSSTSQMVLIDLRLDLSYTLMQIGYVHKHRCELKEAISSFQQALQLRHEILSNSSTNQSSLDIPLQHCDDRKKSTVLHTILEALYVLGICFESINQMDDAIMIYNQFLSLTKTVNSEIIGNENNNNMFDGKSNIEYDDTVIIHDIEIGNVYCSLSNALWKKGVLNGSLLNIKNAVSIYKSSLDNKSYLSYTRKSHDTSRNDNGDDTDQTLRTKLQNYIIGSLQNQGKLYVQLGDLQMAILSYIEVFEMQKNVVGYEHPDIATTLNVLGNVYLKDSNYNEAKRCFSQSLNLYEKFGLGDNDPDLIETLESFQKANRLSSPTSCENNLTKTAKSNNDSTKKTSTRRSRRNVDSFGDDRCDKEDKQQPQTVVKGQDFTSKIIETTSFQSLDDDEISQITFRECDLLGGCGSPKKKTMKKKPKKFEIQSRIAEEDSYEEAIEVAEVLNEISPNILSAQNDTLNNAEDEIPCKDISNEKDDDFDVNTADLLGKINVITCDTNNSVSAKPFEEILKDDTGLNTHYTSNSSTEDSAVKFDHSAKINVLLDQLKSFYITVGSDHPKFLKTQISLVKLFNMNNDFKKATQLCDEMIRDQIHRFGRQSVEVANAMKLKGDSYCFQGQIQEALDEYLNAKDVLSSLYGKNDFRNAEIFNSMGLAELKRDEFDMSMEYLQQALQIQRSHLAPNEHNPDVSQTLVNIGSVYYKERNSFRSNCTKHDSYKSFIESGMLGKIAFAHAERGEYKMAIQFYEEVLQLLRNRADKKLCTPGIIKTLNCIGSLSTKCGQYVEAKGYHEEAMKMLLTSDKSNDSKVILSEMEETKYHLAVAIYHIGSISKSKDLLHSVLHSQLNLYGNDQNPRVARTIYQLGMISLKLCDYDDAVQKLGQALRFQLSKIQKNHPDTLNSMIGLAIIQLQLNNISQASKTLEEVYQIQKDIFGPEHPDVALTLFNLGIIQFESKNMKLALRYYKESYKMRVKYLGIEHPLVASTLEKMGQVYLSIGDYEKTLKCYRQVLSIRRNILGEDHYEIVYSLYNLGLLFTEMKQYSDALYHFDKGFKLASNTLNSKHLVVGDIRVGMANTYLKNCQFEEAKNQLHSAVKLYKMSRYISDDHPKLRSATTLLATVLHEEELCV